MGVEAQPPSVSTLALKEDGGQLHASRKKVPVPFRQGLSRPQTWNSSGQLHASRLKAPVPFRQGVEQAPDVIQYLWRTKISCLCWGSITIPRCSGFQSHRKCVKNFYRKTIRQNETQRCSWEGDIKLNFEVNQPHTRRLPGMFCCAR
jgi:hypothetical protein